MGGGASPIERSVSSTGSTCQLTCQFLMGAARSPHLSSCLFQRCRRRGVLDLCRDWCGWRRMRQQDVMRGYRNRRGGRRHLLQRRCRDHPAWSVEETNSTGTYGASWHRERERSSDGEWLSEMRRAIGPSHWHHRRRITHLWGTEVCRLH